MCFAIFVFVLSLVPFPFSVVLFFIETKISIFYNFVQTYESEENNMSSNKIELSKNEVNPKDRMMEI